MRLRQKTIANLRCIFERAIEPSQTTPFRPKPTASYLHSRKRCQTQSKRYDTVPVCPLLLYSRGQNWRGDDGATGRQDRCGEGKIGPEASKVFRANRKETRHGENVDHRICRIYEGEQMYRCDCALPICGLILARTGAPRVVWVISGLPPI